MPSDLSALVDVHWLSGQMKTNNHLVVLHTSMKNPMTGKSPIIGERVIPTARHFDFEHVFCDTSSELPHTMPSALEFEKRAQQLGVNNNSIIVVYDDVGLYCSPRVWWMFRAMGHQNVYVLDGGLPAWLSQNYSCQTAFSECGIEGDFLVKSEHQLVLNLEQMLSALETAMPCVVDARSAGRFEGTDPEPRNGVRRGHIPKAKNIPFGYVLDNGYLKQPEALLQVFRQQNLNVNDELIFSCGSGVTACILALAAYQVGYRKTSVYDGSWSEWGANKNLALELGKSVEYKE
jgi:thiosulfate/3-mercaptopyruvate sulfurtransferase